VLAAADVAVGDFGSVTTYAAAAGVPVLLASSPGDEIEPGSPPSVVSRIAPRLCLDQPLVPQLREAAAAWGARDHAAVAAEVTEVPGESARIMRGVMYQLMSLPEPENPPQVLPLPVPGPGSCSWLGAL
jgi:hypothetical protein